eukprot:3747877-Pyramimonas_sp.AAC.1
MHSRRRQSIGDASVSGCGGFWALRPLVTRSPITDRMTLRFWPFVLSQRALSPGFGPQKLHRSIRLATWSRQMGSEALIVRLESAADM